MSSRYAHARQMRRAKREQKKLKTYLAACIATFCGTARNRMRRWRSCCTTPESSDPATKRQEQAVQPACAEVECISKGKVHKKYEFGCKVSLATTSKDNWIVGAKRCTTIRSMGTPSRGRWSRSNAWSVGPLATPTATRATRGTRSNWRGHHSHWRPRRKEQHDSKRMALVQTATGD